MREMVAEDEISEWRTSIRVSVSCPVVRPAEPGCLPKQSSFTSRCSVQGAAPLALLRSYPQQKIYLPVSPSVKKWPKGFYRIPRKELFFSFFSWFCELILKIATLLRPFFGQILTCNWPITPDMMALPEGGTGKSYSIKSISDTGCIRLRMFHTRVFCKGRCSNSYVLASICAGTPLTLCILFLSAQMKTFYEHRVYFFKKIRIRWGHIREL